MNHHKQQKSEVSCISP